jgi:hypothetical protein
MIACADDSTTAPAPGPPKIQDPQDPIDVLYNVQLSYNQRNIAQYDKLLDTDFVFYPSAKDVVAGLPDHWGRAEDVLYTSRMFDKGYTGAYRMKSITFDVDFENGVQWVAIVPDAHPKETWYATTGYYTFDIVIDPDTHYLTERGSRAEFVVRDTSADATPSYRLVELHDLGPPVTPPPSVETASVGSATLGSVKALYR